VVQFEIAPKRPVGGARLSGVQLIDSLNVSPSETAEKVAPRAVRNRARL
jgi:hypothetical protein